MLPERDVKGYGRGIKHDKKYWQEEVFFHYKLRRLNPKQASDMKIEVYMHAYRTKKDTAHNGMTSQVWIIFSLISNSSGCGKNIYEGNHTPNQLVAK